VDRGARSRDSIIPPASGFPRYMSSFFSSSLLENAQVFFVNISWPCFPYGVPS
jgi:hypothetical protein